jgi:hypothetical protein
LDRPNGRQLQRGRHDIALLFRPTTIYEKHGTNCLSNTEIRIYTLINGIHTWYQTPLNVPGTSPYNPALDATTGVATNDIL